MRIYEAAGRAHGAHQGLSLAAWTSVVLVVVTLVCWRALWRTRVNGEPCGTEALLALLVTVGTVYVIAHGGGTGGL